MRDVRNKIICGGREDERTQVRGNRERKTDGEAADCQREEERRRSGPEPGSVIYFEDKSPRW